MNPLNMTLIYGTHITKDNVNNWHKLLCKYYSDQGISIIMMIDGKPEKFGLVSADFFKNDVSDNTSYYIDLRPASVFKLLPTILALPPYNCCNDLPANPSIKKHNIIDQNIFLTMDKFLCDYSVANKYDGHELTCRTRGDVTSKLNELISAIPSLTKATNITRLYISYKLHCFVLVLNDLYILKINIIKGKGGTGISVYSLPVLNLLHGFCENQKDDLTVEWSESYHNWWKKFNSSNGATWNDPMILSQTDDDIIDSDIIDDNEKSLNKSRTRPDEALPNAKRQKIEDISEANNLVKPIMAIPINLPINVSVNNNYYHPGNVIVNQSTDNTIKNYYVPTENYPYICHPQSISIPTPIDEYKFMVLQFRKKCVMEKQLENQRMLKQIRSSHNCIFTCTYYPNQIMWCGKNICEIPNLPKS